MLCLYLRMYLADETKVVLSQTYFLLKIVEFCITYLISGWVDCSSAFSVHKFWWQIFYIQCFKILGIAEQLTRIKCINLTDRYVEAVNSILFCSDLFVQLSYYATFITMQARNQGGGAFGTFAPPNFQNIVQQFWDLRKLSNNKVESLYSNHF